MIDPINPCKSEGDGINAEGWEHGVKAGDPVLVGDLELEHHDRNDDRNNAVGEGFKARRAGDMMGHG
jgi:hypothetical protein